MELNLFLQFIRSGRGRVENALEEYLPLADEPGTSNFNEAVRYSIFPGGKRVRPHLTWLGSLLGGADDETALKLACAMEFIHTSSITLDDLPAMDDAELRRNRPALHLTYGQGMALLVSIALLNRSFSLFGECFDSRLSSERLPSLIREATNCIGLRGMIAGQAAEIQSSGENTDPKALATRDLKTSGLMRLMMTAGAIAAGAPEEAVMALAQFGESLGRAYQIYDDIADESGDSEQLGKTANQDLRHQRPTLTRGQKRTEVVESAIRLVSDAKQSLSYFGNANEARVLISAADFIALGFNPTNVEKVQTDAG